MLCAYHSGNRTIITFAKTFQDLEDFAVRLTDATDAAYEVSRPNTMDRMQSREFSQFDPDLPPVIVTHASESARDTFAVVHDIDILGPNRAFSQYKEMIRPIINERRNAAPDERSIAEILGIDKHDPWDHRTEEEKAKLAEMEAKGKKAYADAHKAGQLSGDSFSGAGRKDGSATVTDIKASIGADGQLQIDAATAVKGMHDIGPEERRKLNLEQARKDAEHDDFHDDGIHPQSRKPGDYMAACVEIEGDKPRLVIVPRVGWFSTEHLDQRPFSKALEGKLFEGLTERPEGGAFDFEGDVDTLIDRTGTAGFHLSIKLARFYRATVLGEDIAWKDEDVVERPPEDPKTSLDEDGFDIMVTEDSSNCDYFKTEVVGADVERVKDIVADAGVRYRGSVYKAGNIKNGSWTVCITLRLAQKIEDALREAGLEVETFQVNHRGERLVAKVAGVKPMDRNAVAEIGPRPWNDRAAEWNAMSDEDKEKDRKTWKGSEFLMTGTEFHAAGLVVWITPESYFRQHKAQFPERIDISHLLPSYMEEVAPWTFKCKDEQKDWNTVSFAIENKAQFKDSTLFAIYINTLNM